MKAPEAWGFRVPVIATWCYSLYSYSIFNENPHFLYNLFGLAASCHVGSSRVFTSNSRVVQWRQTATMALCQDAPRSSSEHPRCRCGKNCKKSEVTNAGCTQLDLQTGVFEHLRTFCPCSAAQPFWSGEKGRPNQGGVLSKPGPNWDNVNWELGQHLTSSFDSSAGFGCFYYLLLQFYLINTSIIFYHTSDGLKEMCVGSSSYAVSDQIWLAREGHTGTARRSRHAAENKCGWISTCRFTSCRLTTYSLLPALKKLYAYYLNYLRDNGSLSNQAYVFPGSIQSEYEWIKKRSRFSQTLVRRYQEKNYPRI